ncbi:DUF7946 domain-containing protein [Massilia orientalis]|uniref:Uncharacterized protein n=1 Tax=Massilia orientalis TaxID=3050128 RepID=A0ACC7MGM3_9BURK|nr:hypothetical protein [Massilia sp. YIM B02787]
MSEKQVSLLVRIEGGVADEGRIDLHDAAGFVNGLARATNIVAHAFANDGDIRRKAQGAHGAKAYLHSSRKGCFEEQVDIVFEDKVVADVGHSVLTNVFWDFLTWTWSAAIGAEYEPQTPRVRRISEANDVFIDEIADMLEAPMKSLHKSLEADRSMTMYLSRPRGDDIIKFTHDSLDYVTTREELTETKYITGNVTRFNVLSNHGRIYSDVEKRVLSFVLAESDTRLSGLAITSMQAKNDGDDGKMHFKVGKIISAQGVTKRYKVYDILPMDDS